MAKYGGIAQLARAFGSYPKCRWFKSICRYQWPDGQEVKTPPFHGGITSSILVRVTMENKVIPRLFGGSFLFLGRIAQLVRAFASHARGRGFESPCVHQNVINGGRFLPLLISKAYYLRKKARFWNKRNHERLSIETRSSGTSAEPMCCSRLKLIARGCCFRRKVTAYWCYDSISFASI